MEVGDRGQGTHIACMFFLFSEHTQVIPDLPILKSVLRPLDLVLTILSIMCTPPPPLPVSSNNLLLLM